MGQVAAKAPSAAPTGNSDELKLALARPPARVQPAPTPVTRQPSERPTGATPEFVHFLVQKGDELISLGDISGARSFYTLAADKGDAEAAKKLGDTYNPEFLADHGVQGLQPDLKTAEAWYRKVATLGNRDAPIILSHLMSGSR